MVDQEQTFNPEKPIDSPSAEEGSFEESAAVFPGEPLIQSGDLPENGTHLVKVVLSGRPEEIILIRFGGRVLAYRNRCRHLSIPLDWGDGEVLDESGKLFQCRTHGALFRREDGLCVAGPCRGLRLIPVKVFEKGEKIVLAEETDAPDK